MKKFTATVILIFLLMFIGIGNGVYGLFRQYRMEINYIALPGVIKDVHYPHPTRKRLVEVSVEFKTPSGNINTRTLKTGPFSPFSPEDINDEITVLYNPDDSQIRIGLRHVYFWLFPSGSLLFGLALFYLGYRKLRYG